MHTPQLSVLVAVYNVEQYIHSCVDSILAQSYLDFELILVDDGSTDEGGRICDEYAEKHAGIRVVHKENGGLSTARNAGLDVASGRCIVFVDADDTLPPDALQKMVGRLTENDADILIFGFCTVHESSMTQSSLQPMPRLEYLDALKRLLTYRIPVTSWGKLYRREIFEGLRFTPEARTGQDLLFNIDCIAHKKLSVSICNETVYNYVLRKTSVSFKNDFRLRYGTLTDLVRKSLMREGLSSVLEKEFAAFESRNILQASFKGRRLPTAESWQVLVANYESCREILPPFEERIVRLYRKNPSLGNLYLLYRFLRMRASRLIRGL